MTVSASNADIWKEKEATEIVAYALSLIFWSCDTSRKTLHRTGNKIGWAHAGSVFHLKHVAVRLKRSVHGCHKSISKSLGFRNDDKFEETLLLDCG